MSERADELLKRAEEELNAHSEYGDAISCEATSLRFAIYEVGAAIIEAIEEGHPPTAHELRERERERFARRKVSREAIEEGRTEYKKIEIVETEPFKAGYLRGLRDAREALLGDCISNPIGPLYSAGWNESNRANQAAIDALIEREEETT